MFVASRRSALLALALVSLLGCDEAPVQQPHPRATPAAASSSAVPTDAGAPLVIGALRKQKLDVGTRALPAESIAFAKSRFMHLSDGTLFINALPSGRVESKVSVSAPRRLVVLRDGSALALCANETVLVTERKRDVVRLPRVPLFAQSTVLPDLNSARRFWVLHAFDIALYGYELSDDDELQILEPRELEDFDGRVFALLRDGSFLHTSKASLVRLFLAGKRQSLSFDVQDAFRILPARRLDRVWLARSSGKLELVQILGGRPRSLSSFQVDHLFDVAASDRNLASLRVKPADGGREFAVEVFKYDGKLQWSDRLDFAVEHAEKDDWVARLARNRGIALSQDGKWLAVGGPGAAVVWDALKGKRLLFR